VEMVVQFDRLHYAYPRSIEAQGCAGMPPNIVTAGSGICYVVPWESSVFAAHTIWSCLPYVGTRA
jgi:hypothetical protein